MTKKTKVHLIFWVLVLVFCSWGCSDNNDPSLVVAGYLDSLEQSKPGADKLLTLIFTNSIIQRPATFEKDKNSAVIEVRMLVPDLNSIVRKNEKNCSINEVEQYLLLEKELTALSPKEKVYKKANQKIHVVKEDGVWKIPDRNKREFEERLLTYAQNRVY
jgi:hypothetical protein